MGSAVAGGDPEPGGAGYWSLEGWKGLVADPPARAKMMPAGRRPGFGRRVDAGPRDWTVEGGALVFDGKGESLCTARDYGDFELLVD